VANPNSDTWDPNYFWLVKQYPYYWSEAGDRICAHKDERNQYRFRYATHKGATSRLRGVSCCADTSHSPRFTLRYDDDNWNNEEAVWPASDRSFPSDGKRVGWTYRKNPTTATSTDGEWLVFFGLCVLMFVYVFGSCCLNWTLPKVWFVCSCICFLVSCPSCVSWCSSLFCFAFRLFAWPFYLCPFSFSNSFLPCRHRHC